MGKVVKSVSKGLLGGGEDGADAARDASQAQLQSTKEAIKFQKESRDLARADLKPFREAGQSALPQLQNLINDPNAQLDFVNNNPFFAALKDDAKNNLFNNQAARGKVGSGGTAEALQNSFLLLGQGLVDNQIRNQSNLVNIGQSSAAGQANITQNAGNSIADLTTQGGNAQAAGIIGAQNAKTNANNNLINTALGAASIFQLSDIRAKEDIKQIDTLANGIPVYTFKYKDSDEYYQGVIAQDVLEILPEAVEEIDGMLHVNHELIAKDSRCQSIH